MATKQAPTPTPLRERIRAANEAYTQATSLHSRLMNYAQATTTENVDETFRAQLIEGADPATLLDDYIEAKVRANAELQFGNLIRDLLQRSAVPVALEESFADTGVELCRDELAAIMGRVAEHRTLIEQHPATIEVAVNAGAVDDWRTVEQILDDYDALRMEYRRQVRLQNPGLGGPVIDAVECKHFADVNTYWTHKRHRASILEGYPDREIWEWFRPSTPATASTRAEHLLTIADNDPWMPDADDLSKVATIIDHLCNHRWHTGSVSRDRQAFDGYRSQLDTILWNKPAPPMPLTRRLA